MQKYSSSPEVRLQRLGDLYDEMWKWGTTKYDSLLVKRRIDAVDPTSPLFIVGEAHAADQVRLTGINWFSNKGKVGPTGRYLDEILRCVGFTVSPPAKICVNGNWIEEKDSNFQTAYTTEIFPCFPPGGKAPSPQMLNDAQQQRFLTREIEIMQPKAILLLGSHSYTTFYTSILAKPVPNKISEAFNLLSPTNRPAEYLGAMLIPFMHPSPENGHFQKWFSSVRKSLCDQPQVKAITSAISH